MLIVIVFLSNSTITSAETWDTFIIRNGGSGASPIIQDNNAYGQPAKEFIISSAGQKAGWGSNDMSGLTVGDLSSISIQRLDDYARFTAGSGPAVAPYINIWITDGAGHFAVVANEPSDAVWQPGNQQWNMNWDILKTKVAKIYEVSDKSWLPGGGLGLTFEQLAGFTMQAPTAAQLAAGWTGLGTGAPRELGTNVAYAFNWVFGDTLSNYVSGAEGYVVASPSVGVPEPASLLLLGFGLIGLAGVAIRRKR
jgi:hypothetical protein